jgi:membrane dipeptidase
MSPAEVHADSIVIDGLIIAKWNRELFEDMRKGGLTAANCTVSVWEGFQATVNNITASNKLIRDNSDLVLAVKTTADIRKAKEQGKTGILFGFQNAHAFEDQIRRGVQAAGRGHCADVLQHPEPGRHRLL